MSLSTLHIENVVKHMEAAKLISLMVKMESGERLCWRKLSAGSCAQKVVPRERRGTAFQDIDSVFIVNF